MIANLNWIDYCILILLLITFLSGMIRGLVKEMISFITWVAAFLIAIKFSMPLALFFTNNTTEQSVSYVALTLSFIVLFILVLMVGIFINILYDAVSQRGGFSGLLNHLLGSLLGLGKGLIVVLVMISIVDLMPISTDTAWEQSQIIPYFEPASSSLTNWLSPGFAEMKENLQKTWKEVDKAIND